MKKIGVLLSGCGRGDGSEIHEATLAILHIVKNGCEPVFFAPNEMQRDVYDHMTDSASPGDRNCMTEAARISRGNISDITQAHAADFDALVLPGGMGAVKNLLLPDSSGAKPEVLRIIRETYDAHKPLGFICISPLVGALAFRDIGSRILLTIGNAPDVAAKIEACGHTHRECPANEIVIDEANRVISTPAYMLAKNIAELDEGIGKLISAVIGML